MHYVIMGMQLFFGFVIAALLIYLIVMLALQRDFWKGLAQMAFAIGIFLFAYWKDLLPRNRFGAFVSSVFDKIF